MLEDNTLYFVFILRNLRLILTHIWRKMSPSQIASNVTKHQDHIDDMTYLWMVHTAERNTLCLLSSSSVCLCYRRWVGLSLAHLGKRYQPSTCYQMIVDYFRCHLKFRTDLGDFTLYILLDRYNSIFIIWDMLGTLKLCLVTLFFKAMASVSFKYFGQKTKLSLWIRNIETFNSHVWLRVILQITP